MKASELIEALENGEALGKKIPDHGWVYFWQNEDGTHEGHIGHAGVSIEDCLTNVFHDPDSWIIGTVEDGKFRVKNEPMTVRDLMAILVYCNPSDPVIASRGHRAEGNGYSRIRRVAEVHWMPEWNEVVDVDENPDDAEHVVCIWPG